MRVTSRRMRSLDARDGRAVGYQLGVPVSLETESDLSGGGKARGTAGL